MDSNVILQISLHDEDGIEVRMGESLDINPLILVGILEQVKINIIQDAQTKQALPSPANKYDA